MKCKYQNVSIGADKICRKGAETCGNNATNVCHTCAIFSGDVNFPIKFSRDIPAIAIPDELDQNTIPQKEFNSVEVIRPILELEEPKVSSSKDEEDIPHFVKHIADKIIHSHSENFKTHTHYPTYNNIMLGSACHICNYPVYGTQYCPNCEMIFSEE